LRGTGSGGVASLKSAGVRVQVCRKGRVATGGENHSAGAGVAGRGGRRRGIPAGNHLELPSGLGGGRKKKKTHSKHGSGARWNCAAYGRGESGLFRASGGDEKDGKKKEEATRGASAAQEGGEGGGDQSQRTKSETAKPRAGREGKITESHGHRFNKLPAPDRGGGGEGEGRDHFYHVL